MNYLSRTYAGGYKVAIFVSLFSQLLVLLELVPHIFGKITHPDGVSVAEGIWCFILAVWVVQAVRYQAVKSSDEEDGA